MKNRRFKRNNDCAQPKTNMIDKGDYKILFIEKAGNRNYQRVCMYVNEDLATIISRLVAVKHGRKITITGYLNAVIGHHLESYREEIECYYKENTAKSLM
ncbi:hypothetical protein FACS1894179_00880 [Bacteroidia bacterium]|nr:hypothetical protein FACS1894169_07970 [Bacteroidia bacterium]GHV38101.1 hypothetical protein FACS1894179_00880 [Bacteroidia bacterium]